MPRPKKVYRVGVASEMWYGANKLWWGVVKDAEGNQIGEAEFAHRRGVVRDFLLERERALGLPAPLPVLTAIAIEHLSFSTLVTRSGDWLDFQNVAVWNVRAALEAAYAAGAEAARLEATATATGDPK